jgi:hypothetical protein|tara:strand:- start:865 stop:1170 length:306 start_codon:yes stop_codon:yes gene_type:complete
MQNKISKILIISFALILSGCGTSRVAYDTGHSMSTSAVSGGGRIIGSIAGDVNKGLNVVLGTTGKIVESGGKVLGGGIGLVGGLVDESAGVLAGDRETAND